MNYNFSESEVLEAFEYYLNAKLIEKITVSEVLVEHFGAKDEIYLSNKQPENYIKPTVTVFIEDPLPKDMVYCASCDKEKEKGEPCKGC